MVKRTAFIIMMLFLIQSGSVYLVVAESPFVSDCFEGEENCSELDKKNQEDVNDSFLSDKEENRPSFFKTFIQTIFALLLVLVLIYFLLKFMNKRNKQYRQVNMLENHGGISVGPNKSLQIIRIGSKFYLIGVGNNVEMLQEIEDEDVINDLLSKEEQASPVESIFQFITKGKRKSEIDEETTGSSTNDFTNLLNQELDEIKKNREKIISQQTDKGDQDG